MRRIAVVDAPSNLGLRPPTATSVPGCAKAPGSLRDSGLLARLGARDAGCITPPRYDPAGWQPGDGVAQADEIAVFVRRLADRIGAVLASGDFPVVLGGDCSILLGAGLAMRRYSADLAYRRLIDLVRRTPGDERETVRKHLVSLFTVAGPDDPAVAKARRALASALF